MNNFMLMVAGTGNNLCHYFAGKYPNRIGMIYSPSYWNNPKVKYYMPYALDNGCFTEWNEELYFWMLNDSKSYHNPLWVCVPDVVGDFKKTMKYWYLYKDRVQKYKYKLAFVCQDGCSPKDVPKEAFCCFIGGTTSWKLNNAHRFKGIREKLHIGRVNTIKRLSWAISIGADSVDGSGWVRAKGKQYYDFIDFFESTNKQSTLF